MKTISEVVSIISKAAALTALLYAGISCGSVANVSYPDEAWPRRTSQWAGFPEGSINEAISSFSDTNSFSSLTIIKEGYMVYDRFWGMGPDEMTALYSATKSINSLVVGIAIDRGILKDEFLTVGDFFSGDAMADPLMGEITIEDILTMRTGIDYNERAIGYSEPDNPYRKWLASEDRLAWILARQMAEEPGTVFRYQTPASQLLTRIAEEAANRDFVLLAGELLFQPLGIASDRYLWRLDADGHARVAACNMVPADLARIGLLILRQGMWNGKRIVSKQWLSKSLEPYVNVKYGTKFGYHWWLRDLSELQIIGAEGYGGQCLYIIPGKDLIVVITGDFPRGPEDTFSFLRDYLLPIL